MKSCNYSAHKGFCLLTNLLVAHTMIIVAKIREHQMEHPVSDALKEVSNVLRKLEHYLSAVSRKNAENAQSERIRDVCFELSALAESIDAAPEEAARAKADQSGDTLYQMDWKSLGADNASHRPSGLRDQQGEV